MEEHGSEVINMLFDDISVEEIAEIRAEEAREEGIQTGLEMKERYVIDLIDQGLSPEEIKQRLTQH